MTPDARPITLTRRQILQLPEPIVIEKLVRPQPESYRVYIGPAQWNGHQNGLHAWQNSDGSYEKEVEFVRCPFGPIGQRFWVRERWSYSFREEKMYWQADNPEMLSHRASTLPRNCSRYTLTLTSITVIQRDGWRWRGVFEVTR